jgi:glycosyltransferase involved in cell wall biosynthesis
MIKTGQKILIACDSSKSLMDFRGKLIEELVKQHKVYVFTPRILQPYVREKLISMKVGIYENELKGSNVSIYSDIRYIIRLYKVMRQLRPDIFFPYTFKPVIYGTVLAKLFRIKRITPMLTGLGYNFTQKAKNGVISTITRSLLKFSLARNKHLKIIFQNKDDYQTLLQHKILTARHKVFMVNGSGVDLEHYVYTEPDVENISFLMISRLINAKGIYEYYEAARNIRLRFPDVEFKLIGSYDSNVDAISPDLYNKIKNGKIIQYMGNVDDVRPHIKDASVVVLPSYYGEGVPRCLLEGMAMGRAIITSDSVGCRETVEAVSQINGSLVPVKNIPELVSKIEFYLNNREVINTYGLNGLAYAKRKFDVHLVNTEMLKIMELK